MKILLSCLSFSNVIAHGHGNYRFLNEVSETESIILSIRLTVYQIVKRIMALTEPVPVKRLNVAALIHHGF